MAKRPCEQFGHGLSEGPMNGIGCSTHSYFLTEFPIMFTSDSRKTPTYVPRGTIAICLTLVLGLFTLFVVIGCRPAVEDDSLVVGMDLSYPPFETIDPAGQPVGVSVELAKALAESLGRPLKIQNMPFTGLIPSLQNGAIDCVISSMTDTPERRKSIAFSDPYLSTGLALLVPASSQVGAMANLDQPGRTVIVRLGTTGEVWARENIKAAKVVSMDKENMAVLEVIQGKADGFIYDQMSVWQNQQKNPEKTRALLAPIRQEQWAIGVRLDNEVLREQINQFLKTYREKGGFDRLAEQFLSEQKAAFEQAGVPFLF
jgi:polar amino acid transport system substrate-binding protein